MNPLQIDVIMTVLTQIIVQTVRVGSLEFYSSLRKGKGEAPQRHLVPVLAFRHGNLASLLARYP